MALSLFRFLGALGRTEVIANSGGTLALLVVFVLGGFIISKGKQIIPFDIVFSFFLYGIIK